ncbi:predicted protein [Pyrenophora tritici-repentis Pt-1C-BFP]|uniref:Uncharacterized protein n=1 Tax=Pyrenophora tritici-repentis (strain Pt-1C-BFP) TaxID=426418 RepID=B2VWW3_PYRTR|nr:uncharacterized protein PTRG_01675 [Pyrenophora tritici-repentis Pt-1C-BFP]EDU41113.1 predicted protein [Pyrenophora tritici-repentis Pt-1C-BFP]
MLFCHQAVKLLVAAVIAAMATPKIRLGLLILKPVGYYCVDSTPSETRGPAQRFR